MAIAKDGFHRKRLNIEQNLDSLSYAIQMRVLPSQKRLVASNRMVFKQIKPADKIVFL